MINERNSENQATRAHGCKAVYQAPRLDTIGKVTELTSGPVTTHAEGTGMGFKS